MKLPHPIPYQGSKRNLADQILRYFPEQCNRLIEPFAGSAAMTIAAAYHSRAQRFLINDINVPLVNLWHNIINDPMSVAYHYANIWHGQLGREEAYYYEMRTRFNETQSPEHLLFMLAKCVKAAVRYNAQGQFNQSPDKRRLGRRPESMREEIQRVSQLLQGRTQTMSENYQAVLDLAMPDDLVYMDPPYQGTGQNGGFNYAGNIEFDNFVNSLFDLINRDIPFILSYDGKTGEKTYGNPLPNELGLTRIEIHAGRSSQATLLKRTEYTVEALYLSPALAMQINLLAIQNNHPQQAELFA